MKTKYVRFTGLDKFQYPHVIKIFVPVGHLEVALESLGKVSNIHRTALCLVTKGYEIEFKTEKTIDVLEENFKLSGFKIG